MKCGSYRAIKLLEHAMKVIERVFERRSERKYAADAMQFGFMPGKGTTDAIFTVRQMQKKYGCKGKKLSLYVKLYGPQEGVRKKLGDAGPHPLRWGMSDRYRNMPLPHRCYLSKFGRSRSN